MAESKRAAAEEEYELPVPPFDAPTYVRKDLLGARAVVVLAIYGVLLGQVGSILAILLKNSVAALGVFFFGLTAMKGLLETVGVPVSEWDRKTWAGNLLLLFFTWLAAWVLFLNEPFLT